MSKQAAIPIIGSASGLGANDDDCGLGPVVLQNSALLRQAELNLAWQTLLYPHGKAEKSAAIPLIADLNNRLALSTQRLTQQRQPFVVIGGDHSCAIGTWSGAATALQPQGELGLVWVDAHLDSHTPQTTETNNVHGMPLACLLGYGDDKLTHILSPRPKLRPENICVVGVRSFESGEAELLQRLKVRVYFMDEVRERGLATVFQEALTRVRQNTVAYGLSIDLDALDPLEVPGVGAPEPAGITTADFYQALALVGQDSRLLGAEIVEFDPKRDQDHKTEKVIIEILRQLLCIIRYP